jgi:hypothetical protein
MIYEDIFRELHHAKIQYLVVGGVAINLYGVLRSTADLDMMLQLADDDNVKRFIGILKSLNYRPRAPVSMDDFADPSKRASWIKEKGAVVFTFLRPDSYEQIDVFLSDPINFDEAYKSRKDMKVGDLTIAVPSVAHLKALKRIAHREKDLADIKQLEKLEKLDHEST